MPLNKSIRLPLRVFISKASPSRRRFVIPEMCMAHSGLADLEVKRNMPLRHGGCGLALGLAPNSRTNHERICGIGKGCGRGSRQLEPQKTETLQKRNSRLASTDCAAGRCTEQPAASNRLLACAESFMLMLSCELIEPWLEVNRVIRLQVVSRLQYGQGVTPPQV